MNSLRSSSRMQRLTLRDRIAGWKQLLDRCGRKPTRKRVHALRVVTLRIQAELEHELAELPHASHQAQAMLRFSKLAEKLRQALGPVRELDVWIGKLQSLRGALGEATEYVPRSTRNCIRQIEQLEERLNKKRQLSGQKLMVEIEKRRKDLLAVGDDIHESTNEHAHEVDAHSVSAILEQFTGVAAEFPTFDEENLHDFRKRIKKVRYLAEIHSAADPACGRIAGKLKKLQAAIGEWHDWQILARTAKHGRHAKNVELEDLLESLTIETFEAAIAMCHSINSRMLGLYAAKGQGSREIERKPPMRSDDDPSAFRLKLA